MKKTFTSILVVAAAVLCAAAAHATGLGDAVAHLLPVLASPDQAQSLFGLSPADAMVGLAALGGAGITTFVQNGDTLTLTPAAAVTRGQGYLFGAALFGVATADVGAGAAGEFICEGVVDITKTAALAIAVGDRVFWDSVNKCVNKTVAAQQQVGICVVAAAGADATVRILLESALPVAT